MTKAGILPILSKLPHTGNTIFTSISNLATRHGAINLGQGFPGFPADPALGELVKKYMDRGMNQYAPMAGIPELRRQISQKMTRLYGADYSPENEITVTAGGTQAIFTAITALVHPGDEVILFAPAYDCYAPAVELNGGIPVWIELHSPDYAVNWDLVSHKISDRTRMIIVNTPHNPSGGIFRQEDMESLEQLVKGTNITVLSDEVYEHILFDGNQHQSCARFPGLAANALIVYSFGKTYHVTGWKMGYAVGPASLMSEFRKVHQFNVFSCNTPVQYAFAEYMEDPARYTALSAFYQRKRDFFLEGIKGSRFEYVPSAGTYFQLLRYKAITDERDTDFAVRLIEEYKIAGIPCSVFYPDGRDEHVLRFCFAKEDEVLQKAADILGHI